MPWWQTPCITWVFSVSKSSNIRRRRNISRRPPSYKSKYSPMYSLMLIWINSFISAWLPRTNNCRGCIIAWRNISQHLNSPRFLWKLNINFIRTAQWKLLILFIKSELCQPCYPILNKEYISLHKHLNIWTKLILTITTLLIMVTTLLMATGYAKSKSLVLRREKKMTTLLSVLLRNMRTNYFKMKAC